MDYEVLNQETVIDQDAVDVEEEQPEAAQTSDPVQKPKKKLSLPMWLAIISLGALALDAVLMWIAFPLVNVIPLINLISLPLYWLYDSLRFAISWGAPICALIALIISLSSKKLDPAQKKSALRLSIIALIITVLYYVVLPVILITLGIILIVVGLIATAVVGILGGMLGFPLFLLPFTFIIYIAGFIVISLCALII